MLAPGKAGTTGKGSALPQRLFGQTGQQVSLIGLGGEGVLRSTGKLAEASRVIHKALDLGINYFDTAPAYESSMDYYGSALAERRDQIFLACKTHERGRDASLRLLDDCLERLRTEYLDLWQLHDLRTMAEVNRIFAKGGVIEAFFQARADGRVRYLGLTGHHDPNILAEAMRRFDFDSLLVALNPADVHRASFINLVLPEAVRQGMAVIAMKVTAQGKLLGRGKLKMEEALGYVLSLAGVSTAIVGCRTAAEVEENVRLAGEFIAFAPARMRELEARTRAQAATYTFYKK